MKADSSVYTGPYYDFHCTLKARWPFIESSSKIDAMQNDRYPKRVVDIVEKKITAEYNFNRGKARFRRAQSELAKSWSNFRIETSPDIGNLKERSEPLQPEERQPAFVRNRNSKSVDRKITSRDGSPMTRASFEADLDRFTSPGSIRRQMRSFRARLSSGRSLQSKTPMKKLDLLPNRQLLHSISVSEVLTAGL